MYDELDQLLKLTKFFEAEAIKEDDEDDLQASILTYDEKGNPEGALQTKHEYEEEEDDEEYAEDSDESGKAKSSEKASDDVDDDADNDDKDDKSDKSIEDVDDDKPYGSSGNVTKGRKGAGPIFEPDEDSFEKIVANEEGCPNDGAMDAESLGMPNLRKSMKMSLTDAIERGMGREFSRKIKFEAANPLFVSNAPFKLGDVVSAKNNPMLYVVKNNDGSVITAAKPTANQAEFCKCKDGCWPEFTFNQDEIQTMDNASMNDLGDIVAFNDRFRGFDGTIEDRSPMDRAQEYAQKQTIDDISHDLDEILGQYQFAAQGGDKDFSYTECSPTVVFRRPDGSVTTEQQMGGYQIKWGD